jgi:hypothetical protein
MMKRILPALLLLAGAALAAPTGTVTRSVITDTNGVLTGLSTNFAAANGIATTAQVAEATADVTAISNLAAAALSTGVTAQATSDAAMATGIAAQAVADSAMATGMAAIAAAADGAQAMAWISSWTNAMLWSNTTVAFDYFLLTSNPAVPLDNADFPGIYRDTGLTTNGAAIYTNAAGWYLWRDTTMFFWDASTDLGNECFLYQSLADSPASTWIGTEHCGTVSGEVSGVAIYATNTAVFSGSLAAGLLIDFERIKAPSLPTSPPGVSGAIWNSNGVLRVEP